MLHSTGTWGYYFQNNDLLLHLSDLNNDLFFHSTEHLDALLKIITCSKQWKGALRLITYQIPRGKRPLCYGEFPWSPFCNTTISLPFLGTLCTRSPSLTNSRARAKCWRNCPCRKVTWEGKRRCTSKNKFNLRGNITYSSTPNIYANASVTRWLGHGITLGISLVIIANNSNKERTITFHDERVAWAVLAVSAHVFCRLHGLTDRFCPF